jgi:hypothetical protein
LVKQVKLYVCLLPKVFETADLKTFLIVHGRSGALGFGNNKVQCFRLHSIPGIPVRPLIEELGCNVIDDSACSGADGSARSSANDRTEDRADCSSRNAADDGSCTGFAGGRASKGSGFCGCFGSFGSGVFIIGVTHGIAGGFDVDGGSPDGLDGGSGGGNPDGGVSFFHSMFLLQK